MRASLHRKIGWWVVRGVRVVVVALNALSVPEKPSPGGVAARITVFGGER